MIGWIRRALCGSVFLHEVEIGRRAGTLFEATCVLCGWHRWGSSAISGPLLPWTAQIEVIFQDYAARHVPAARGASATETGVVTVGQEE